MRLTEVMRLVRQGGWQRWTLASFLARLPMTMTLLALVLVGEEVTGSLAVGAQLAGVATFTTGVAAPWRGRRLDAGELRAGLQRAGVLAGLLLAAQAAAVAAGLQVAVLFVLAAGQGLALAAVSGGYRALLSAVVPREDLARANAFEAVSVELGFVVGPALAGTLALLVGPVGVLVSMAVASITAAAIAGGLPQVHSTPAHGQAAPWRTPGVLPVYGVALTLGVTVGLLESAMPARASDLGYAAASAGPLLALIAAGSGLGGLAVTIGNIGARRARLQATLLLGSLGLLLVPVSLAGSAPLLAVALFVAGMPIAPLNALGAMLLQETVPPGRQAEGFSVYVAAIVLGAGTGQIVTGSVLGVLGAQGVLMVCAGLPLALGLIVAQRAWRARRLGAAA